MGKGEKIRINFRPVDISRESNVENLNFSVLIGGDRIPSRFAMVKGPPT